MNPTPEAMSFLLVCLAAFVLIAALVTTYLARCLDRALERIHHLERTRAVEHAALSALSRELPPEPASAVQQFVSIWSAR